MEKPHCTLSNSGASPRDFRYAVKPPDKIYEYACHEGNFGMVGILSGHRAQERMAAEGAIEN